MTTGPDRRPAEPEALKHQALDWLARLSSGEVTEADADAFRRWCATSPAHAQAFAEANLLWGVLGPATRNVAGRAEAENARRVRFSPKRRAFLGGAAATAAVAGYLVVRPPLSLWPSFSELIAEYRTGTGERRQLAVAGGTAVEMNTQTSLNVATATAADRIDLIAGEAVVTTSVIQPRPVIVTAANGRTSATNAKFAVRLEGSSACVTCLEGSLDVEHHDVTTSVREKQQVTYGDGAFSPVVSVDPALVTSWRAGVLIFRGESLSRAVEEINRYRPGRIVVVDSVLGRRRIDASFRLDHIEDVVPQIERVFGARVRTLPGGVVLLG